MEQDSLGDAGTLATDISLLEAEAPSGKAVRALALAAGMPISDAHLPGVTLNLARLLEQGRLVMAVPLGTADEPAAIFAP